MTPLTTETLNLTLTNNIARMRVCGTLDPQAAADWLTEAGQANDNVALRVELASDDFEDLAAVNKQFRQVGDVLRRAPHLEKCAVVTDSIFVRNTAKVEGSVIPGLEVRAFDSTEAEPADAWLKGESLMDFEETTPADTAIVTPTSPQKAQTIPDRPPVPGEDGSDENPWDGFSVKDLDL